MIWEAGGQIHRLPASIETPVSMNSFRQIFVKNEFDHRILPQVLK